MGCCTTRKPYQETENYITIAEAKLNFQANDVRTIYETIRVQAQGRRITTEEFMKISQLLFLDLDSIGDAHSPIHKAFQALERSGKYDTTKILLLGILMGKGTVAEKAEKYFETMDTRSKGNLLNTDIRSLLEDLTDIVINLTPNLVDTSTNSSIKDYQMRLNGIRSLAIESLDKKIMEGAETILKPQFFVSKPQ